MCKFGSVAIQIICRFQRGAKETWAADGHRLHTMKTTVYSLKKKAELDHA